MGKKRKASEDSEPKKEDNEDIQQENSVNIEPSSISSPQPLQFKFFSPSIFQSLEPLFDPTVIESTLGTICSQKKKETTNDDTTSQKKIVSHNQAVLAETPDPTMISRPQKQLFWANSFKLGFFESSKALDNKPKKNKHTRRPAYFREAEDWCKNRIPDWNSLGAEKQAEHISLRRKEIMAETKKEHTRRKIRYKRSQKNR